MKSVLLMTIAALLLTIPVLADEAKPAEAKEAEAKAAEAKAAEAKAAEAKEAEAKAAAAKEAEAKAEKTSFSLPDATPLKGLTFLKGKPVTFKPGKIYIVEFWATWCPPCRTSIPHLTAVQKKFKDKGVTVIGVSNENNQQTVQNFVDKQGDNMDYTVAWDPKGIADKGYMKRFKLSGIPHAFIVDGAGKVAWDGYPGSEMDSVLAQIVDGTFDAVSHAKAKAKSEELRKQFTKLYFKYAIGIQRGKSAEELRPVAEEMIKVGDSDTLNSIAWAMLTNSNEQQRDPATALKAAAKANQLTKSENSMVLDTYALALFQNGKIAKAVKMQEKALELTPPDDKELTEEIKTRLEEFKQALAESK